MAILRELTFSRSPPLHPRWPVLCNQTVTAEVMTDMRPVLNNRIASTRAERTEVQESANGETVVPSEVAVQFRDHDDVGGLVGMLGDGHALPCFRQQLQLSRDR
jgi:hypothetical protein